ncbi:MAG: polyprenyl synthetase family protein [Proteobacteria bacterium]|nr:polyprenyl synthetase family protein [Pseudomonadota bacterium]
MTDTIDTAESRDFESALSETASATETALERLIPQVDGPESRVVDAMRYSALGGGKRVRPFLIICGAEIFDVPTEQAERVAAAAEMIHTYSLIHDDLPAMDDDDLRRGQPSCHKKFDEATAILAGDGLLTLAFEVLGESETHPLPAVRCELTVALAKAIGAQGMVGGQMLDLVAENQDLDMPTVTRLQRLKTGALIEFCCQAGAILGQADEKSRHHLHTYSHDLGLAFQIVDDLLDVEGSTEEIGKTAGKDADAGKATFVSLLGAERAREQAGILADQAAKHLEIFGNKANLLQKLAKFVVERRS